MTPTEWREEDTIEVMVPQRRSDRSDGWGEAEPAEGQIARRQVEGALDRFETPLPISPFEIDARTTENRIDLADNISATQAIPQYGGYLELIVHGDASGTQADISGERIDLDLEQTARIVQQHRDWNQRPIKLMSCHTGAGSFAQELADTLGTPIYAPDAFLNVLPNGDTYIADANDNQGSWRRFEPRS